MLERLVQSGVLGSLTAGSLDGKFGATVRRFSLELLRHELVHNVASDAHGPIQRPPTIIGELERAGLGSLAGWLTEDVPSAILADEAIPPRPKGEISSRLRARWLPRRR
jgi:protein-tyrosine phosphatase